MLVSILGFWPATGDDRADIAVFRGRIADAMMGGAAPIAEVVVKGVVLDELAADVLAADVLAEDFVDPD